MCLSLSSAFLLHRTPVSVCLSVCLSVSFSYWLRKDSSEERTDRRLEKTVMWSCMAGDCAMFESRDSGTWAGACEMGERGVCVLR